MARPIEISILFYMTDWHPEKCLSQFVVDYMAPRLLDESLKIGGEFFLYFVVPWKKAFYVIYGSKADGSLMDKGRRQNSVPLTTNISQNSTEPSKGISYPVGDLCQCFTKLTGLCAYMLHSYPIPSTDGTNCLL